MSVEGELGCLGSLETGEAGVGAVGKLTHDMMLIDPDQAKDILAIERIARIHAAVPNTRLVMHGSSSVPRDWLAIIRQYGGDIKETHGVPVEETRRGIDGGVRKINIDTDIRLAMTGAMRKVFAEQPSEFDPRKAARGIAKARFEALVCAGHAAKIKPVSLDAMALRYP